MEHVGRHSVCDWGQKQFARITKADMTMLFDRHGECIRQNHAVLRNLGWTRVLQLAGAPCQQIDVSHIGTRCGCGHDVQLPLTTMTCECRMVQGRVSIRVGASHLGWCKMFKTTNTPAQILLSEKVVGVTHLAVGTDSTVRIMVSDRLNGWRRAFGCGLSVNFVGK